ncbi:MAG: citramalate synthase, partial [Verrucomicrobiales bacterium]|nr:citramalate synthase [Verrucomicrobiales bacterium]
ALKMKKRCVPPESLPKLKELSQFVDEIANIRHNTRLPWVGSAAFSHKGGQHVNAVQKIAQSYEHIDPALVGNKRTVLISDLAGRSNIVLKAQELGFKITNETPELKAILARVKDLEHAGYEFEAAEGSLALLIRHRLKHEKPPFAVETYHVSMRRDVTLRRGEEGKSICEATVKVRVGGEVAHTVAEGDGPVNALDSALRAALIRFFPRLKTVMLTDYKVRIIEAAAAQDGDIAAGTAAKTRVLIESTNGKDEWGTVGVSANIIEASLQALVDSMEYALMKK